MFHLRKLTLQNFRCFAHAELALEDDITVLFAENGGGKTSILWAISILLAGWLYHPPQTLSLKWRRDVRQERSERGQWQPKGGCTIRGDWELGGQTIQDNWRFTKVYVRQGGQWRVVAFHASEAGS